MGPSLGLRSRALFRLWLIRPLILLEWMLYYDTPMSLCPEQVVTWCVAPATKF